MTDGIINFREETLLSQLRLNLPLSYDLHGCSLASLKEQAVLASQQRSRQVNLKTTEDDVKSVQPNCQASPLQAMLPYVVVLLTAVLPQLADPCPNVRSLASCVFTKLLILLPLEVRSHASMHRCTPPS